MDKKSKMKAGATTKPGCGGGGGISRISRGALVPNDGFGRITRAFLNVTNVCPLACKYCFVHQNEKQMDYQIGIDSVNFLASNANMDGVNPSIVFFGGEPLVRYADFVKPLTVYIREKYGSFFNLSITTNGVLLNEEILSFLKGYDVGILFSMDGGKPTQDTNRPYHDGTSSFNKLDKDVIPVMLKYYPNVTFRSTITPFSAKYIRYNTEYAHSCGFKHQYYTPDSFDTYTENDIKNISDGIHWYADKYIETMLSGEDFIILNPFEDMFKVIMRHNRYVEIDRSERENDCKSCGKCGMGATNSAAINTNGNIVTCQEFLTSPYVNLFTIGNIYDGVNLDKRKSVISMFEKNKEYNAGCSSCILNRTCDGGCVANNYLQHKDMAHQSDIICHWRRILFKEATRAMQQLGERECERFKERWNRIVKR